ncbi:MAG: adenylosuccinate lyase [Phycisphaerales bacterium]|nr:adenylosuccinate lyase [Phycisphaerales bacterium]
MTSHAPIVGYRSALETRNASAAMRGIWSDHRRFTSWRRIWLALAQAQMELSLGPTQQQVEAIRRQLETIDHVAAEAHERRLRHDVMAHVHTLGDQAPAARAIIHLGATSQDVVCNADALLQHAALTLTAQRLARVIDRLGTFATAWRDLPCLGFTHFQPAQPVTVGRRATLWAQEFAVALAEVESRLAGIRLRGLRGATGTQASFLALCKGDAAMVDRLEHRFAELLGWPSDRLWLVTGQTYPRIWDAQMLSSLAIAACSVHKCATDIRLLCNLHELDEPSESDQIGSSAMPYKRNPMRCERATGLARFVISLVHNAYDTASTQWLERTLDDSSNRRLSIPEAFLALDGALEVMANVVGGLVVYPHSCKARLTAELPFLATEDIMLAAVAQGADRQDAHERIRTHARAAAHRVKGEGAPNDLLDRLRQDGMFATLDFSKVLDAGQFIGRCREQVDGFVRDVVEPIRVRYDSELGSEPELRV